MERSSSIYGSSSALRGVHLKIGENFKPPSKVTLPVGWKTRDTSRLLNLTYDFSLEEEVLKKIEAEREAREQHEQAQKIKELVKASTANPALANIGGEILQPTTVTATNSLNLSNENKEFNYKDFEDNTDTPFEAVELQCIDNMDALKSVLQPDVQTDSVTSASSQSPFSQGASNAHGIPIQESRHASAQGFQTNFPSGSPGANQYPPMYTGDPVCTQQSQIGQTVAQNTNPFLAHNSLIDTSSRGPVSTGIVSVSPQSNTVTYSPGYPPERKISLPGAMRVLPVAPSRPPPRRPASVSDESTTSETMSAFPSHVEAPLTSTGQRRPIPKPRSKLPPLRNGAEAGPHAPISPEPPPIPPKKIIGSNRNAEQTQKPEMPVDDPSLKRYPSPLPPISPPKRHNERATPPPPVHDPRATMSREEVQLVNQLSAMGFPLARVARAVKNLGCKEREVIEFLISVNDVCNLGYSEVQVEMVLKENSNQEKAVEFLKLIKQFKELGFQEEKIFEALKKSECDSNKTLDILTCAG